MLISNGNYIFDKVESKISSKSGKEYKIAHVKDADNYQRLQFFVNDKSVIDCPLDTPCQIVLMPRVVGFATNYDLVSITSL